MQFDRMRILFIICFTITLSFSQIPGFEANRGNFPSKVTYLTRSSDLFGDGFYFTSNSVVLSRGLRLALVDGNPQAESIGEAPLNTSFNTYIGSDPKLWREDERHFWLLRMKRIYPGIDALWNMFAHYHGSLTLSVSPEARHEEIRFRLGEGSTRFEMDGSGMIRYPDSGIAGVTVSAVQLGKSLPARFRRIDQSTFAIYTEGRSANVAMTITIIFTNFIVPRAVAANRFYSESAIVPKFLRADLDVGAEPPMENSDLCIAATDGMGRIAWVSTLGGKGSEGGSNDQVLRFGSRLMVASVTDSNDFPVSHQAPQPQRSMPQSPGQYDLALFALSSATGRLFSSTYFGGPGNDFPTKLTIVANAGIALTGGTEKGVPVSAGAVSQSLQTGAYGGFALQWDFSSDRFSFTALLATIIQTTGTDLSGTIHFISQQQSPESQITIGALDEVGRRLLFSAAIPHPPNYKFQSQRLRTISLGLNGDVAMLSAYEGFSPLSAKVNERLYLSVYSKAERRLRFQRFVNEQGAFGQVRLMTSGAVEVAVLEHFPTSQTTSNAAMAASCGGAYFQRFDENGKLTGASYFPQMASAVTEYDFPLIDPLIAGAAPAIHCAVPTSHRLPNSGAFAPGQLITITGGNFGPSEAVYAMPDASGRFPHLLAGISASVEGLPAPLIAVARGLVAVQIPFEAPEAGIVKIAVTVNGISLAPIQVEMTDKALSLFNLGVADEELRLPVMAALNQDGTVNSRINPAARGSFISVFATGLGRSPGNALLTGGLAPLDRLVPYELPYRFNLEPVEFSFSGAAPGLSTGLYQLNLRIPDETEPGRFGLTFERNLGNPSIMPPMTSVFFVK